MSNATSFGFFTDSALTYPAAAVPLIAQISGGSTADVQLWLGSLASGTTARANSNPGTDQIVVSITDSATSSGHAAAEIKLAPTQAGLAAATGGVSLDLGTSIPSGTGSAVSFWARFTDATGAVTANVTDLGLTTNTLVEA